MLSIPRTEAFVLFPLRILPGDLQLGGEGNQVQGGAVLFPCATMQSDLRPFQHFIPRKSENLRVWMSELLKVIKQGQVRIALGILIVSLPSRKRLPSAGGGAAIWIFPSDCSC